ncbi:hypothetical protein BaRGS_00040438 [Batillaria attramentaria]|uniref:Uncharacterized protein n=1 Tax=Batillaria attramentaria TaxID=370345 RepID=A0ABD0J044_9CAEN
MVRDRLADASCVINTARNVGHMNTVEEQTEETNRPRKLQMSKTYLIILSRSTRSESWIRYKTAGVTANVRAQHSVSKRKVREALIDADVGGIRCRSSVIPLMSFSHKILVK